MKRACVTILFMMTLLFLPQGGVEAALVPCDGADCQACHVVELGSNIINWLITVMVSIIALVFMAGGFRMVMSGGDTGAVTEAKHMMTNAIVGFIIVLLAWLIIDTVFKMLVKQDFSPWKEIQCVAQPKYLKLAEGQARPVVGGGTDTVFSPTQSATQIQSRISATDQYRQRLCAEAAANGIADQCNSLQAVMAIESAGKADAQSDYAAGLMQMTPDTARATAPELFSGKTDAEIAAMLKDPDTSIKLGVEYYAEQYRAFNGDLSKIYAAYNGGPGANNASANCDGMLRWQCEWDNDAHTILNTGYAETRKYVPNVNAVRCELGRTYGGNEPNCD